MRASIPKTARRKVWGSTQVVAYRNPSNYHPPAGSYGVPPTDQEKQFVESIRTGEYKGMPADPLEFQHALSEKQRNDLIRIVTFPK